MQALWSDGYIRGYIRGPIQYYEVADSIVVTLTLHVRDCEKRASTINARLCRQLDGFPLNEARL